MRPQPSPISMRGRQGQLSTGPIASQAPQCTGARTAQDGALHAPHRNFRPRISRGWRMVATVGARNRWQERGMPNKRGASGRDARSVALRDAVSEASPILAIPRYARVTGPGLPRPSAGRNLGSSQGYARPRAGAAGEQRLKNIREPVRVYRRWSKDICRPRCVAA